MDFLPTLWPLSVCLLFATYKSLRGKLAYLIPLCVNLLAMMFFVSLDRYNIMINYDTWADRGMVGPFEEPIRPKVYEEFKPAFTKEEIEEMDRGSIKIYDERGRLVEQIYPRKPTKQKAQPSTEAKSLQVKA